MEAGSLRINQIAARSLSMLDIPVLWLMPPKKTGWYLHLFQ